MRAAVRWGEREGYMKCIRLSPRPIQRLIIYAVLTQASPGTRLTANAGPGNDARKRCVPR